MTWNIYRNSPFDSLFFEAYAFRYLSQIKDNYTVILENASLPSTIEGLSQYVEDLKKEHNKKEHFVFLYEIENTRYLFYTTEEGVYLVNLTFMNDYPEAILNIAKQFHQSFYEKTNTKISKINPSNPIYLNQNQEDIIHAVEIFKFLHPHVNSDETEFNLPEFHYPSKKEFINNLNNIQDPRLPGFNPNKAYKTNGLLNFKVQYIDIECCEDIRELERFIEELKFDDRCKKINELNEIPVNFYFPIVLTHQEFNNILIKINNLLEQQNLSPHELIQIYNITLEIFKKIPKPHETVAAVINKSQKLLSASSKISNKQEKKSLTRSEKLYEISAQLENYLSFIEKSSKKASVQNIILKIIYFRYYQKLELINKRINNLRPSESYQDITHFLETYSDKYKNPNGFHSLRFSANYLSNKIKTTDRKTAVFYLYQTYLALKNEKQLSQAIQQTLNEMGFSGPSTKPKNRHCDLGSNTLKSAALPVNQSHCTNALFKTMVDIQRNSRYKLALKSTQETIEEQELEPITEAIDAIVKNNHHDFYEASKKIKHQHLNSELFRMNISFYFSIDKSDKEYSTLKQSIYKELVLPLLDHLDNLNSQEKECYVFIKQTLDYLNTIEKTNPNNKAASLKMHLEASKNNYTRTCSCLFFITYTHPLKSKLEKILKPTISQANAIKSVNNTLNDVKPTANKVMQV